MRESMLNCFKERTIDVAATSPAVCWLLADSSLSYELCSIIRCVTLLDLATNTALNSVTKVKQLR